MSSNDELKCLKVPHMMKSDLASATTEASLSTGSAAHVNFASDDSTGNYHSSADIISTHRTIVSESSNVSNGAAADSVDNMTFLQSATATVDRYDVFSDNLKRTEVQHNHDGDYFLKLSIANPLSSDALTLTVSPTTEEASRSGLPLEEPAVIPADKNSQMLTTRRESLVDPKTGVARKYIKLEEEIGRGSFKTVYKGLDCETGVNIAWCELMDVARNTKAARLKFKEEVEMLKGLRHQNILRFYDSWEHNKKIVLVTELMTSGTLKEYIKRFRKNSVKLIANWCRQILNGLVFLHTRTPPVIHRDLKCDNFFINGQIGRVKIGDLGLAILKPQSYARTVIGTPEYMAPEMYEEHYDESVDVYAFGMCMLEMATSEYPYKECTNPAQIYRRVTKGKKPESYQRVESSAIRDIIDSCIQTKPEDRMNAAELLQLDFFNEWSVHIECTVTSRTEVLRFRITDDVIRNKRELQKDGEAVQFHFDMNTDNPEMVAQDLVNSGYLDKGNVKVAVKIMLEKIKYFRKLRLTRSNSLNNEHQTGQQTLLRTSSEHLNRQISDEAELNSNTNQKRPTELISKKVDANGETNAGNVTSIRRKQSVSRTSIKDSESKVRKRKPVTVLIQEIATKDHSTIVTCELHSGKATVIFSFNCDLDKAEDITVNLGEYLADGEQHKTAKEQISFMIETVKTHITQPDIAKIICEQRASVHAASVGSTACTPCHSRSNSKELLDLTPDVSPIIGIQDLQTTSVELVRPLPYPPPSHLLVGPMDETYLRDRSTTWSSNSSKYAKPDTGRKMSESGVTDPQPPSPFRPNQLAMIQSTPGTPVLPRKFAQPHPWQDSYEDISMHDESKWDDRTQHLKKALDITELGKSIENIMSGQMEKHSYPGHISHPYGQRTRLLSSTSRADGEIISPNDSLGTNSTNCNSLTCDSGFCSILPQPMKQNIISEPIAETTKKVGRFAIGVVKEQTVVFPKPSIPTPFGGAPVVRMPVAATPNVTSPLLENVTTLAVATPTMTLTPMFVAPDVPHTQVIGNPKIIMVSDADHIASIAQTPSTVSQIEGKEEPLASTNKIEEDDDQMLEGLKARQAEETGKLELKHKFELQIYKTHRRILLLYRKKCSKCAALQSKDTLCEAHGVASSLHMSALQNNYSKRSGSQPPGTPQDTPQPPLCTAVKELDYVSTFLRNGKHCNKNEGGRVRRIRHNSVEQLLHRMKSIDSDTGSPCSPESADCPFTIPEETDSSPTRDNEQPFRFPTIDKQQIISKLKQDYQESAVRRKKMIKDELTLSHDSVLKGLQFINDSNSSKQSLTRSTSSPLLVHTQQKVVKQALDDSRAQIIRTINSLDS